MPTDDLSSICCQRNADAAQQRAAIETALKAGADLLYADKNGVTAMHHAGRFSSPAAVQTLIEHGAAVKKACQRSGSTPLHRAVTSTGAPSTAGKDAEAREIIEILLRFGADPSIKNKNGKTPADYCRDETLLELLAPKRPGKNRGRKE
jgi:tankyrase